MQRKRPLESLLTPAAAPGGGVPVNGNSTRIPKSIYDDPNGYDRSEYPPMNKRRLQDEEYSYYGDEYSSSSNADSWIRGYERESHPSQFSSYPSSHMGPNEYEGYGRPPSVKANNGAKRKLTCELPWPSLPERAPNSKFGLGLDRYGHEVPSPLMEEFQDTVKEMQNEIAFLKRHPEVATRIPHAVRILEKGLYIFVAYFFL